MEYEDELQNKTVFGYLREWQSLIKELSEKEIALIEWKELYEIKADKILENAKKQKQETGEDIIKTIYGGNNDKTRKKYVKDQLTEWDKNIFELELSIDWINRRISFIKHYVKFMCKED